MPPVSRERRTAASRTRGPRRAPRGEARRRLLDAALRRFEADGALAATLEDIRREAGVSTGALYHHFPDKAALAAALYAELLDDFQQGFLAELRSHPQARGGVEAGVRYYLRWVGEHRAGARFLLAQRPPDPLLRDLNAAFFAAVMAWWRTHVHYGSLRELPFEVINALWLGPAHEYSRHWLAGRGRRVPAAAAALLADAAWQTLKEDR
jgi:AcrR family transcriptional regulator